eukprot:3941057-Rhodomonas_salina.2
MPQDHHTVVSTRPSIVKYRTYYNLRQYRTSYGLRQCRTSYSLRQYETLPRLCQYRASHSAGVGQYPLSLQR